MLEALAGAEVSNKKGRKRYVHNVSKKVQRVVKEAKHAKRVLNEEWPETVTCKVCYKKKVPVDNAIFRLSISGKSGYWVCKEHLEQKFAK